MIPVEGFEEQYTIAENGDVTRIETGRVLKPTINKQTGYLYVSLWKNNIGKTCTVHRLVALAYIPNPDNKPEVNHKDSERLNPCAYNLEWSTRSENAQHGYTEGFNSQAHRRNFKDFELDIHLQSVLAGENMTAMALGLEVGLSRLSINLRKRAKVLQLEETLDAELWRQKLIRASYANTEKRVPIIQNHADGTFIQEHESATAAAKTLGRSSAGSIHNALTGRNGQRKAFGYIWTYS